MGTKRRGLFQSWFSVGALLALGGSGLLACSDAAERRPDEPRLLLSAWGGAPPQVAVALGEGADAGQHTSCQKALAEVGVTNAPEPAVAVLIDISRDNKILHVTSRTRGPVRQELRPAWDVHSLCRDALSLALRELQSELAQPALHYTPAPVVMYTPQPSPVQSYTMAPPAPFAGGRPDDPWSVLNGWNGPPPQVTVVLGTRASARQRERCAETVRKYALAPSPYAPFTAEIETETSSREQESNVLRVFTPRGLAVYGYRPGWGVDELCKDGLAQVLRAFLAEYSSVSAIPASQ